MTHHTCRHLSVAILLAAVTFVSPLAAQTAAVPSVTFATQWDSTADGAAWTQFARDAIDANGSGLITAGPRDMTTFCPNYAALSADDRRTFWVDFLSALARSESKNDPSKSRWHFYNADARRPVVSRGLFQISIESANRKIYQCDVAHAHDLAQPQQNIDCAVRILTHWVASDGAIAEHTSSGWNGAARYWGSLRSTEKRNEIAAATAQQSACAAK